MPAANGAWPQMSQDDVVSKAVNTCAVYTCAVAAVAGSSLMAAAAASSGLGCSLMGYAGSWATELAPKPPLPLAKRM